MRIEVESVSGPLKEVCSNCASVLVLPNWVSKDDDHDVVVFQCPECRTEAEIDISDRPRTDVRLIVNGQESPSSGSGAENAKRT